MGISANSTSVLGFTPDKSTTNQEFDQGTVVIANGTTYTYVKASAAVLAAGTVLITGTPGNQVTGAGATHNHQVGATIPLGEFFWARKVTSTL